MTVVEIDWGDYPDWRDRLEAARRPQSARQRAWDAHFAGLLRIARRTESDPTKAVVAAYTKTEAQYGQRPANEETT